MREHRRRRELPEARSFSSARPSAGWCPVKGARARDAQFRRLPAGTDGFLGQAPSPPSPRIVPRADAIAARRGRDRASIQAPRPVGRHLKGVTTFADGGRGPHPRRLAPRAGRRSPVRAAHRRVVARVLPGRPDRAGQGPTDGHEPALRRGARRHRPRRPGHGHRGGVVPLGPERPAPDDDRRGECRRGVGPDDRPRRVPDGLRGGGRRRQGLRALPAVGRGPRPGAGPRGERPIPRGGPRRDRDAELPPAPRPRSEPRARGGGGEPGGRERGLRRARRRHATGAARVDGGHGARRRRHHGAAGPLGAPARPGPPHAPGSRRPSDRPGRARPSGADRPGRRRRHR
ncbi:MAG: hypothetical protein AVDCRST_MAG79-742 [uncultured Thermoleophilia bacterium]|uniref:Uncharacterized protein n=1 Tax=uncultured Thermoleophilia bacterium TaxID=1497501 RepID=A0A6J4TPQ2_9ACTN|nr:MAG: hypothetical protein AVDCRST_MAG79-742 [uncultured Thermoleophilia bacterium]